MSLPSHLEWRKQIVLAREIDTPGERVAFFSRLRSGEFLALFRGVYVRTETWQGLDRHSKYRAKVTAAAALANEPLVFSHHSAAVLWRLPAANSWPERVHVLQPRTTGNRSTTTFVRHTVGLPHQREEIDGYAVTSLARTVIDLAVICSFAEGVTFADAALRRTASPLAGVPASFVSRDDLRTEIARLPSRQGSAKARRVADFADGCADRPGESLSRVNMRIAGLSNPQLQVALRGASGAIYFVDFWWPEFNLIGEFDGRYKYSDPEFLRGRTPAQALIDEKYREDDLRAAGHGMSRWTWEVAVSPWRLRAHLMNAGVQ